MPDLLIRNVHEKTVSALKNKAAKNKHSLQQELLQIIESAAREDHIVNSDYATMVREQLQAYGSEFTDSTKSIRADRSR